MLCLTKSSDAVSLPVLLVGETATLGASISPNDGVGVASGAPGVTNQGVATLAVNEVGVRFAYHDRADIMTKQSFTT